MLRKWFSTYHLFFFNFVYINYVLLLWYVTDFFYYENFEFLITPNYCTKLNMSLIYIMVLAVRIITPICFPRMRLIIRIITFMVLCVSIVLNFISFIILWDEFWKYNYMHLTFENLYCMFFVIQKDIFKSSIYTIVI